MNIQAIFLVKVRGLPHKVTKGSLSRQNGSLIWELDCRGHFFHWSNKSKMQDASEIQRQIKRLQQKFPSIAFLIDINVKTHSNYINIPFEPHHLNMSTYWD